MTTKPLHILAAAALGLALGGCGFFSKAPGTSVVEFYNNSGRTILVEDNELRPNRQGTFKYPTESGTPLIVFWSGCVHTYIAPDRKPGEFRGTDWMLRGAYRAQLEADGRLFLLPPSAPFPAVDVAALAQPPGFPLVPREGSSCLQ
jgi:hypothetical protein